ncbi:MAG: NAD(P)/FAD-dependent oxidoreductase [Candidatus Lokiarchaeota archaeon]|nr:NAD(P)/FAD-dependent oxidoreductase [Candidatus Lokiarchaeota archaeon]
MITDIKCDALVIGAGPAGLTAALYLRRANVDVLVIRGKVKSALEWAHDIGNYTGIKTIKGAKLLEEMTSQVEALGARFLDDDVIGITTDMSPKMASTKTAFITADVIVIATGKGARKPVLDDEERYIGLGVSYCATCDGPLYKNRPTAVIGDDNEAAEDALILDQMGTRVTWIIKDKELRELEVGEDLVSGVKTKGIPIIESVAGMKLVGDEVVKGLDYETKEGVKGHLDVDCAFVMTSVPTTTVFKRAGLDISESGNITVDRSQQTSQDGIFACGDVCGNGFQVSIAVGEGAVAGMNAAKYLRKLSKDG